ncbi:hypothetical protein WDJ51_02200 [Rathayibacter sp. YIM 133350]|uniref:hypothetical protein n=1 Tax=Rathayibacter sp. YIM 133350 TaxID=3131992 RepID=UPI00307F1BF3
MTSTETAVDRSRGEAAPSLHPADAEAGSAREERPRPRGISARSLGEAAFAVFTGIAAMAAAWWALGLNADMLRMRWTSGATGDQMLHYMVSASATDWSLFTPNERLGFPFNQNLFFAPMYDPASAVALSVGAVFVHDPVLLLNLYQLVGFFVTGVAGYLLFRGLRTGTAVAVVFGLIFALAPYHFQRVALGHAFVGNYWGVAVLVLLLLVVGGERTDPFARWAAGAATSTRARVRHGGVIIGLALLLSLTNSYYYVFGALLMGILLAVRGGLALGTRKWRRLIWPAVAFVALVAFVAAQLAVLSLNFGDRYAKYFSERSAAESEFHAGKIATLLLPWPGSGLPRLGAIADRYAATTTVSPYAEPTGMSVIAIIGILLAILFWLARLASPLEGATGWVSRALRDSRLAVLASAMLAGVLFFVVGGFGYIFAAVVTGEIRSWVRLSIVLATLGLGFVAVIVNGIAKKRGTIILVLTIVAAVAFVDQLAGVRAHVQLLPTRDSDLRALVQEADQRLPSGCGIAELPVKAFPESGPILGLGDYEEALPYVVGGDSALKWSYGAVSGTRSADFWKGVSTPSGFAAAVRDSDACAIYVDRAAYDDDTQWQSYVSAVLGSDWRTHQLKSPDTRQLIFTIE